jgi:membrane peptidoglycan carboxypeptidase
MCVVNIKFSRLHLEPSAIGCPASFIKVRTMIKQYFSNLWIRLLLGIRSNKKKSEQAFGWKIILVILIVAASWIVINELRTSRLQAFYFSNLASRLKFNLGNGASSSIRFPKYGPYDERLGYSRIPEFTEQLIAHGFSLTEQARMSPAMLQMQLPPIYPEKDQAGLILRDRNRQLLYSASSPERVYASFEAIPKLLTDTLLFIEDRDLLDSRNQSRNPVLNWSRLDRAVFDQVAHKFSHSHETPGASTLVTQIEKFRHSPHGRTQSFTEKFRQMESASIRTYLNGENNMVERRKTVVAYLNTVPLSAQAGYGEILGIGDGMWVWYGCDFSDFNNLLNGDNKVAEKEQLRHVAETYKQALSLIIAQRRPSFYLGEGSQKLIQLTNSHLRLLESAGIISHDFLQVALPLPLQLNHNQINSPVKSFESGKATTSLRTELAALLGIPHLYDLDRIDMAVNTTIDGEAQRAVSSILHQMKSPVEARSAGLYGHNMLRDEDNPSRLAYSFTLFERNADANLLRVQTDNLNEPFDLNSGARLNLGSTAKLRTLITYLEVITRLHESYSGMNKDDLSRIQVDRQDVLSRWAFDYFASHPHCNLPDVLEAAMERTYSGNPLEAFLTGGGIQRFENFEPEDNSRMITVREGFQRSINLVFVRLMRDIVRYYEFTSTTQPLPHLARAMTTDSISQTPFLNNTDSLHRQAILSRFADKEGRDFLSRFYIKYKGKTDNEAEQILFSVVRAQPERLAILFRSLEPDADFQHFTDFMHHHITEVKPSKNNLKNLYAKFAADNYSLNDRG